MEHIFIAFIIVYMALETYSVNFNALIQKLFQKEIVPAVNAPELCKSGICNFV